MPFSESVRAHNARIARAREQANRDLHKPIRHMVTDVNEESLDPDESAEQKSLYATRHMVALLGRLALEQEKTRKVLASMVWIMAAIAILLGVLTYSLLKETPKEPATATVSDWDIRPKAPAR